MSLFLPANFARPFTPPVLRCLIVAVAAVAAVIVFFIDDDIFVAVAAAVVDCGRRGSSLCVGVHRS